MVENNKKEVSEMDKKLFKFLRDDVSQFLKTVGSKYDKENAVLLDIAPQDHEGAKPYFSKAKIETLDLDNDSDATYIADVTTNNENLIPSGHFDFVVCTEVLEHTLQPFDAVNEIERVLKKGGFAFVSTPFNFRIHGPLPDCWRFTEHGLKALFKNFEIIELKALETEDRFLMPLHYTLIAKKQ
jgi:SAM-dependent methyltransferase